MDANQQKIVRYFSSLESRLGYDYLLWGSKHLGFYPDGNGNITEKEAQVFLQDLVAKNLGIKENQIVLDAGCGQGIVSAYLAKKYGSKVVGITIVPFEVKKAEDKAKEVGVQNKTQYFLMDYLATTFADNFFDAIYTIETLSHSPDVSKTLKEFFRVLKPGGKIALFEYTIASDNLFSKHEKEMLDFIISNSAMMGLKSFRHDNFPGVIMDAGFQKVTEQNITKNVFPSFSRLHKFTIWPYKFIRFFGLQKKFINTTAGYECYKMAEKGLIRYCIFTGTKL
jgi:sterol 24-C-methyltransferase